MMQLAPKTLFLNVRVRTGITKSSLLELQMKRGGLFSLLLMTAVLLIAHIASAQTTASIWGRIECACGAAVPHAMVTLTSLETGAVHTPSTDASAGFRVLQLP